MLWYEHLLGILAIATCVNWIVIAAAIRVGDVADRNLAAYRELRIDSEKKQGHSATGVSQSLGKIAELTLLKKSNIQN